MSMNYVRKLIYMLQKDNMREKRCKKNDDNKKICVKKWGVKCKIMYKKQLTNDRHKGILYGYCERQCAGIAQLVEHFTRNEGVVGSSPISSFFCYSFLHVLFTKSPQTRAFSVYSTVYFFV